MKIPFEPLWHRCKESDKMVLNDAKTVVAFLKEGKLGDLISPCDQFVTFQGVIEAELES